MVLWENKRYRRLQSLLIVKEHKLPGCLLPHTTGYLCYFVFLFSLQFFLLLSFCLHACLLFFLHMHFKTKVSPECFAELNLPYYKKNKGKYHTEIIGKYRMLIMYSTVAGQSISILPAARIHTNLKQRKTGAG